jgi:hypothetical protein
MVECRADLYSRKMLIKIHMFSSDRTAAFEKTISLAPRYSVMSTHVNVLITSEPSHSLAWVSSSAYR